MCKVRLEGNRKKREWGVGGYTINIFLSVMSHVVFSPVLAIGGLMITFTYRKEWIEESPLLKKSIAA